MTEEQKCLQFLRDYVFNCSSALIACDITCGDVLREDLVLEGGRSTSEGSGARIGNDATHAASLPP